jgi:hypothetical protein
MPDIEIEKYKPLMLNPKWGISCQLKTQIKLALFAKSEFI